MAKYTEAELRAMPDHVVRYLAPMQCMEEVRAEAVRRFVSRNRAFCDTSKVGLFISYWRCNYTGTVRIMRHEECASPSAVAEMPLIGEELTDADVQASEALLARCQIENDSSKSENT